jgi:hypothetical protein
LTNRAVWRLTLWWLEGTDKEKQHALFISIVVRYPEAIGTPDVKDVLSEIVQQLEH